MKRELKAMPEGERPFHKEYRKAHPDEKGTESWDMTQPDRLDATIARPIPMKRELKGNDTNPAKACNSIIARPIPMKRELKGRSSTPQLWFQEKIARPIPMKRELKDHRLTVILLSVLQSQGPSR